MANLKEVRTRIASVSSTQQITSAMKMVSAAKFRRAQTAIIGMRPYVAQLHEIIDGIDVADDVQTPYHAQRPLQTVKIVVVTSNKGLCGAFNSNIIKLAQQRIDHYLQQGAKVSVISIGRKASEQLAKRTDIALEVHDEMLDGTDFERAAAMADRLLQEFAAEQIDAVELVYNQFKNSLAQVLMCEPFLPVVQTSATEASSKAGLHNDYIYEPSKEAILREMIPLTLRSTFYRMLLDSLAAEHGARMTAMQKATDNASELLKELRLTYNKARQASITNEIIEIVSGSEALKG